MLRQQPAVVRRLAGAVVEVGVVFGPGAVAGAVAGAVGHQARLQAAVPAHGPVEVEPRDQRLPDVDALGPVDGGLFPHGFKGALEAHGEDQLLLLGHGGRRSHFRVKLESHAPVTRTRGGGSQRGAPAS